MYAPFRGWTKGDARSDDMQDNVVATRCGQESKPKESTALRPVRSGGERTTPGAFKLGKV
jgi:hypothetical protein